MVNKNENPLEEEKELVLSKNEKNDYSKLIRSNPNDPPNPPAQLQVMKRLPKPRSES